MTTPAATTETPPEPAAATVVAEALAATPPFQFLSASNLSPHRREHLENWHRNFLAKAAGGLTDLLRFDVSLELKSLQIHSYGQVSRERADDQHAILFRMKPHPGIALLDAPLAFAQMVVERMTGGVFSASTEKARSLTAVEETVFHRFGETVLAAYARNWLPQVELRPEIVRQERRPSATLHDDDDLILLVAVRVLFKGGDIVLRLITPIGPIEDLLAKSVAAEPEEKRAPVDKDKKSPLASVPVPVSIRWHGFQISLRDLDVLAEGDVLMLDSRKCERAAIWLGNRPKFEGRVVREPLKTTVTITGNLD